MLRSPRIQGLAGKALMWFRWEEKAFPSLQHPIMGGNIPLSTQKSLPCPGFCSCLNIVTTELGNRKNKAEKVKNEAGKVKNEVGRVKNKAGKVILGLSWRWLIGFNGTLCSQREILRGWVEIPSWQLQGDSSKEYLDSPYLSKLSPEGEKKELWE